jgi:hypothetical protein
VSLAGDHGSGRRRHPGDETVHQAFHRKRIEGIERERRPVAADPKPGSVLEQLRTGKDQYIYRQIPDPVDQMIDKVKQPRVGVVGVLQPAQSSADIRSLGRVGHKPDQAFRQLLGGRLDGLLLGDPKTLPDDLCQGPERHAVAVGQATTPMPQDGVSQPVDVLLELPSET